MSPSKEIIPQAKSNLENYNIKDSIVIYIGGLEPIYNIKELLKSIEYLDDWTLIILGAGSLSEYVKNKASDNEQIIFPETVPHKEIPGYLKLGDVGVSLVDDVNTLKILEYSAGGIPTVQLRGKLKNRNIFKELLEFCFIDPKSIAEAIEKANKSNSKNKNEIEKKW